MAGLAPRRRGRKPLVPDPQAVELRRLRDENARLAARLAQAETVIEVQKKLSELVALSATAMPDGEGK